MTEGTADNTREIEASRNSASGLDAAFLVEALGVFMAGAAFSVNRKLKSPAP